MVKVLIYVFDITSRTFKEDLIDYEKAIGALKEFSPQATVFCLFNKVDLISES